MGRIRGDLKERTFRYAAFAMQVVGGLPDESRSWILGKQFGRSSTSIGANVWEADGAISDADFVHKMSIARKEAQETIYWTALLREAALISPPTADRLHDEATELANILTTIVRKTQSYLDKEASAS